MAALQAVSESISPEKGDAAGVARPAPPQSLVPAPIVKTSWFPALTGIVVVVVDAGNVLEVVVVAMGNVLEVVVVGGPTHGFGSQVPAPRSSPPAAPHTVAGTRMQLSNAPDTDDCTQH